MAIVNRQRTVAGVLGLAAFAVVATPFVAGAATDTANTLVRVTIGSTISVTSSGTVTLPITPVSGGNQTAGSDAVSVSTNNAAGYTLAIKDADATLALTHTTAPANTIAASSHVWGTPNVLANNTWGYAVASATAPVGNNFDASYSSFVDQGAHASNWVGITASDRTIRDTSTTASGEVTTVWYSAKADTTKPNGDYEDTVTYTATTK